MAVAVRAASAASAAIVDTCRALLAAAGGDRHRLVDCDDSMDTVGFTPAPVNAGASTFPRASEAASPAHVGRSALLLLLLLLSAACTTAAVALPASSDRSMSDVFDGEARLLPAAVRVCCVCTWGAAFTGAAGAVVVLLLG